MSLLTTKKNILVSSVVSFYCELINPLFNNVQAMYSVLDIQCQSNPIFALKELTTC